MLRIGYSASFVRRYKKLTVSLKHDVVARIEEFKNPKNHRKLAVHKLTGRMRNKWTLSINYSDRIVFEWSKDKKTAFLLDVGDHGVYE